MATGPVDAERLWLETLQLVTGRASHELKGALNGVSVNLEVVRGRSANPELPASALARFAESAATQLDHVIEMNEALLALARRPREPADVAATLRHVAALVVPGATASGMVITVDASTDGIPVDAGAPALVVRTVFARILLAMVEAGGGDVRLRAVDGTLAIDAVATRDAIRFDERTAALAAAAGIHSYVDGQAFTLTFPGPATALEHRGAATHGIA